ncbi:MAG: helix-turn-helix transcriptional regulator [Desulfobacterales bacterium]|nr:helix-turn-helix transcriptional regulator [Desulfobacterales bacterium]
MKATILTEARRLFGEYGYHGTTTRMIAKAVGIDISTLYYHWGEKKDLFEAVLTDIDQEIEDKLKEIEKQVRGKSIKVRLEVAIDVMCDYWFSKPEVSNLIINRYISKTRHDLSFDLKVPEYISNIAIAMKMAFDKQSIAIADKAKIIAVWNSVFNFVSGENYFRPLLNISHDDYIQVVKDTLKFILLPAFTKNM